jgi:cardiolipin synthase
MGKVAKNLRNHVDSRLNVEGVSNAIVTLPNTITLMRILLVPLFAYCMGKHYDLLAISLMVVCAGSDFLDGFLARKMNSVTKTGKILDPIADRLMIFITLIMLTALGSIPVLALVAMFTRETMLFFLYGILILNGKEPINVQMIGKIGAGGILISMPLIYLTSVGSFIKIFTTHNFGQVLLYAHNIFVIMLFVALVVYWVAGLSYAKSTVNVLKELGVKAQNKIWIAAVITFLVATVLVGLVLYFMPDHIL